MSINNPELYNAAISGAMGGTVDGQLISNTSSASYATLVNFCRTYATAVDAAIPTIGAGVVPAQVELMAALSRSIWSNRYPVSINSAIPANVISAIVAAWTAGCAVFAEESSLVAVTHARGVCTIYVDIAAFDTDDDRGTNDGIDYEEGDIVLLFNQNVDGENPGHPEQNGPWVVGAVNISGIAPLTRPSWWAASSVVDTGSTRITVGAEGLVYGNTVWKAMGPQEDDGYVALPASTITIGTDDPGFYPEMLSVKGVLVGGQCTVHLPIYSLSSGVSACVWNAEVPIPVTAVDTVKLQVLVTPGIPSRGAVGVWAIKADGTQNAADVSKLSITVCNQSFEALPS